MIIILLALKFEGKFKSLQKIQKSIKILFKIIEIYKNGKENVVTSSCKITLLIVQDLRQLLHQMLLIMSQKKFTKANVQIMIKESVKENSIHYKCLSCNKNHSSKIDEELKKIFKNEFEFSNNHLNKFILLLRKGTSL